MNLFKTFDGIEFLYEIVDGKVSMQDKEGRDLAYDDKGKPVLSKGKLVKFVQSKWFQIPYVAMTVIEEIAVAAEVEARPQRKGKVDDV